MSAPAAILTDGDSKSATFAVLIIVPAHNAVHWLPASLAAIDAAQNSLEEVTGTRAHVLVVDDASTDGTHGLLSAAGVDHLRSRDIDDPGTGPVGPGRARNRGVASRHSDIVVFVDADVFVHQDALRKLVQPLVESTEIAGTFGSYDDRPPERNVTSLYANLRHHTVHQAGAAEADTFWSGLGAMRRSVFEAAGGFSRAFDRPSIEDIELGLRVAERFGRLRLVHDALGTHAKHWTLLGLWRTDISQRAIPWARLLVTRPVGTRALNADARERSTAWIAASTTVSLVVALFTGSTACWLLVGLTAAAFGWRSRTLLGLLYRRGGARAWVGGFLLHITYYHYAAMIFAVTSLRYRGSATPLDELSRHEDLPERVAVEGDYRQRQESH